MSRQKKNVHKQVQEEAQVLNTTELNPLEQLKELMSQTIEQARVVMELDRSKVLRLKGLVKQLEDVQRRII